MKGSIDRQLMPVKRSFLRPRCAHIPLGSQASLNGPQNSGGKRCDISEHLTFGSHAVYWFAPFRRPVFILSAPRAGSSFLFELLQKAFLVWGGVRESDTVWWSFVPYNSENPTDHIPLDIFQSRSNAREWKLRYISEILSQRRDMLPGYLFRRVFHRKSYCLDKTIANAFHLDVLYKIFPDARFIYLIRDGRANVASMIEAWKSGVFWKRPIPPIPGATIGYWTFPFPPGWQEHARRPLEEICAWSWIQHNRWISAGIERLGLTNRVHVVRYEDLIDTPGQTLIGIERALHLRRLAITELSDLAANESWSTVSSPSPDKWKKLYSSEITRIEAQIAPMMLQLGYAATPS